MCIPKEYKWLQKNQVLKGPFRILFMGGVENTARHHEKKNFCAFTIIVILISYNLTSEIDN